MKFITKGETINCVRIIKDKHSGKENRIIVASFGAGVDRVAPHVEAELYSEEVTELKQWLLDRSKLQSRLENQPIAETILESLPLTLEQATQAIKDVDHLDSITFRTISERLSDLSEALDNKKRFNTPGRAELKEMKGGEEQKERLDTIKRDIENK